jgi:FKBP-type peptidyl-prolyl cis-trans isomerase (trigger factor)
VTFGEDEIEQAVQEQMELLWAQLNKQGLNLDMYCRFMNTDEAQLRADARPDAIIALRSQAAIDKIVELEGLQATDQDIAEALAEGQNSVGTELNIRHVAATPVGLEVRAEAEVTAVEGRVITFEVKAYDESGLIGEGSHKRAVINAQKFLDKTYAKL